MHAKVDEDERIRRLEMRLSDLDRQVLEARAELRNARERCGTLISEMENGEGEEEEKKEEEKEECSVEVGEDIIGNGNGDRDGEYDGNASGEAGVEARDGSTTWNWPMKREEYKRYGRQLIMPEIGIRGQLRLKRSRVLVVGVGGLGCPATAYLAGAGVGTIGLVDGDVVEESNLARQILHTTARATCSKVVSAIESARALNPNVKYRAHVEDLLPETAADIVRQYDIVLDCTDHPTSRYLVSDMCVLHGIPLVSASALRVDGQLLVLNNPPRKPGDRSGGPCYRCIFPKPPPPESLVTCGDGGILGPVVGVMGVLQALEAIKIIIAEDFKNCGNSDSVIATKTERRINEEEESLTGESEQARVHHMLLFSAIPETTFRTVRIRGRRPNCSACSSNSTITLESIKNGSLDYDRFCRVLQPVEEIDPSERITVQQLAALREKERTSFKFKESNHKLTEAVQVGLVDLQDAHHENKKYRAEATSRLSYALVDIRNNVQFDIAHLPESINIPFSTIELYDYSDQVTSHDNSSSVAPPPWAASLLELPESMPIHVVCRRGNDSQIAVKRLKQHGLDNNGKRYVGDVIGGISYWTKDFGDHGNGFPDY